MRAYFYVYVLRSLNDQRFYVGFTKNLRKRIQDHERAWFLQLNNATLSSLSIGRAASTKLMPRDAKST